VKKKKFSIEYPLNNASTAILWKSISSDYGLLEWFADDVNTNGNTFTFKWDDHEQDAELLQSKQNECIRFQWAEDKGSDAYFEMRIATSDLSKDLVLVITDYAAESDIDDSILLWNQQIETLKRVTGL